MNLDNLLLVIALRLFIATLDSIVLPYMSMAECRYRSLYAKEEPVSR